MTSETDKPLRLLAELVAEVERLKEVVKAQKICVDICQEILKDSTGATVDTYYIDVSVTLSEEMVNFLRSGASPAALGTREGE